MGTSGAGNAANFIAGGSESMTSPSVPSYPETCRAGHPWATSAYVDKRGCRFCKVCCELRRREKALLKRSAAYKESLLPVEERLALRIDKTPGHGPKGECWVYTRYLNPSGYGMIADKGIPVLCHRLAFQIAKGPIPEVNDVCHSCDFPPCCRPDHLFAGTRLDNILDMIAKGRGPDMKAVSTRRRNPAGERNGMAKLTWETVRAIRAERSKVGASSAELAELFNIPRQTISGIIFGRRWKEAPIEPVSPDK